jgi:glycine C-acetyltransferase
VSRQAFLDRAAEMLRTLDAEGLAKPERVIASPQGAVVEVSVSGTVRRVLNFSANNYLGLANDPRVVEASLEATRRWGAGVGSVRFICGTLAIHKELEAAIADYVGAEAAILFPACFDANGGIFDALLGEEDAIVSDTLNHASVIDGVRLSKAKRYRYAQGDMDDLERQLAMARAANARAIMIATDGVFSMDGYLAKVDEIAVLADRFGALIMMDDCHATGVIGPQGRGAAAAFGLASRVDVLSGTFGKALSGAMGGFVAGARPTVDLLRQKARPYLFSNALAPGVCGAALEAIRIARGAEGDALRDVLAANARRFRAGLEAAGFDLVPGATPIVPVLLGDARLAAAMAETLLRAGVLAPGFSFPVVPHGRARIRVQLSAAHTEAQVDTAIEAMRQARAALA